MFNVRLAGYHLYGKWLFTCLLQVMSFDSVLFCAFLFSHEMSWMKSGTELSQFIRTFTLFTRAKLCRLNHIDLNLYGHHRGWIGTLSGKATPPFIFLFPFLDIFDESTVFLRL